ncbi:hydroxymethylglutaryl-CoA lyase [Mangrovimicrobium sediminis]|uniref:hydroxymethylglutaryl-CoA lyase n=1 Tax=Mangrovimicrobium sediminis TaxID=2562682 RepID=A0A4Z0M7Q2_9GAMM|nr:hydroxymethylglutaryl-CoA lyase [Haliea sp. SAOS-164]TGD75683.1 hydroxymethylglutaryl-CoA lyase [Haliea sp. SAOS-164]
MTLPSRVTLVEVGPRDGLQNRPEQIPLAARLRLLDDLAAAGLTVIETGSFVNPQWVPQMADSEAVFRQVRRAPGVRYTALTPNLKGFERAMAVAADEIAIMTAASESFSQKNTNCSIEQSLERLAPVAAAASETGVPLRGYISCALGCPYEGEVDPHAVHALTRALFDMGCYEVSIGDTIGTGTAGSMARLLDLILSEFPAHKLAVHCHDTYGQALANILVALQRGIATVDASVAGLGGCPYAAGAAGNVATEDVVYMLHGMGIETGINLPRLVDAARHVCAALDIPCASHVANALKA